MSSTISILEGSTFVVSDRVGDIEASPDEPLGLFAFDTRFLSRWVLTLDGKRPTVLSTDDLAYFRAQFFLAPSGGNVYVNSPISIMRKRAVGDGFHEDLTIFNSGPKAVDIEVRIEAAADFADLFEVKDALKKKGDLYHRLEGRRLVLGYKRERFVRETWVTVSAEVSAMDEKSISFRAHIPAHGEWTTCLDVVTAIDGALGRADAPLTKTKYGHGDIDARPNGLPSLQKWTDQAPDLRTSWDPMKLTYTKSLVDLAALRVYPSLYPNESLPAAGLPWFMAVFGRDSVITSLQALPFASELAETTLKLLAMRQGTVLDSFRDEEPGKILHEARWGELTAFEERPHSPYFGSADVTPLWLILLDEYERWTGDEGLVRRLEKHARAALRWIDDFGDRDGDGYVEYATRNEETGLVNQCWKDSWDSICFADGSLASLPRATCEIQGYVYDAKRRCARLAREIWGDQALADRLDSEATSLRRRFNDDFWVPERGGYFALALDGKKRKVDAMTSNMGHLLWSGIADPDKADKCVKHLMSDRMFTGWGIRTLAEGEGSYNPIGYHVGTVWPHDTAFVAWGLRRYGYREHAARLAYAMFEAANCFQHRLPEAFAGYSRESTRFPVEYPTACSPQAWATGAPLVMLRVMLGLVPVLDRLFVDPAVPAQIEQIELLNIRGRWGTVDAFGRGRVSLPMQKSLVGGVDGRPLTPEQVVHR